VTKVLFISATYDEGPNEIVAVFPYMLAKADYNYVGCYAHIGQHSAASEDWVLEQAVASEPDYRNLLSEISGLYGKSHIEVLDCYPDDAKTYRASLNHV
jgi:hypothetical protein